MFEHPQGTLKTTYKLWEIDSLPPLKTEPRAWITPALLLRWCGTMERAMNPEAAGRAIWVCNANKFESIKTSTWKNIITDMLHSQRHRSRKAPVSSPWLCSQGGEWFMTCWTTGAVTAAAPSGFQCATRRRVDLWTTSWTAAKYMGLRIERSCCGGSGADDASAVLWSSSVSAPPSCLSDGVKIYIDLLRLRGVLLKGVPKSSKSEIYDHTYPPVNYHRPWKSPIFSGNSSSNIFQSLSGRVYVNLLQSSIFQPKLWLGDHPARNPLPRLARWRQARVTPRLARAEIIMLADVPTFPP